jgi:hypothetical protein
MSGENVYTSMVAHELALVTRFGQQIKKKTYGLLFIFCTENSFVKAAGRLVCLRVEEIMVLSPFSFFSFQFPTPNV